MKPGDVYVLNNPYNGGTHLPDVTVITPVFDEDGARTSPCSSSPRAAITPISAASRPARCRPTAARVEEEGVLIDDFLLVDAGRFREAEIARAAAQRRAIRRAIPTQNLADLKAQVAACEKGVAGAAAHGRAVRPGRWSSAYMRHVQDNAEEAVRRVHRRAAATASSPTRWTTARVIRVRDRDRPRARGAPRSISPAPAPQLPTNFNAPPSVCKAAVLYVFRTLVDDDIPLNDGCLKPLEHRHSRRLDAAARAIRRRWSPAMSRPRNASPTRSTARSGVHGGGAGHDEQLHLRQRALPVLRDDLRRLRRRARISTAPTRSTRT